MCAPMGTTSSYCVVNALPAPLRGCAQPCCTEPHALLCCTAVYTSVTADCYHAGPGSLSVPLSKSARCRTTQQLSFATIALRERRWPPNAQQQTTTQETSTQRNRGSCYSLLCSAAAVSVQLLSGSQRHVYCKIQCLHVFCSASSCRQEVCHAVCMHC